jgi:quercetin dioxygenase-like cupin family protein
MQPATLVCGLVLAGAMIVGAIGIQGLRADEKEYKTTAKTTKLVDKVVLAGLPGQEASVRLFEMPPGWVGGKHYHPGHVFVYVLDGAITFDLKGKAPVTVREGEIFHEVPNQVMQAKNPSASEGLKFIAFQVGTQGKPMMIEAK